MKLRRVVLAVLTVFILVGGPMTPRSHASTLIGFTDTDSSYWVGGNLYDASVFYGSWTQTVPSVNTSISAIVALSPPPQGTGPITGYAWLTNKVGPGTTAMENEVSNVNFTLPIISESNWHTLTASDYTVLFTGLSLLPGTYYLTLHVPCDIDILRALWLGDALGTDPVVHAGVEIHTAPGFTVGSYGLNSDPGAPYPAPSAPLDPLYIPATPFWAQGTSGYRNYFFYSIEGNVVPEPTTMLLLGSGLLGLAGYGRKKFFKK